MDGLRSPVPLCCPAPPDAKPNGDAVGAVRVCHDAKRSTNHDIGQEHHGHFR